jgi:hypothetical protein
MINTREANYKWYVLGLAVPTFTFVFAMPMICMPVLFKEISEDLGLNLVEVGMVWGIISLTGAFTVFIGGLLADLVGLDTLVAVSTSLREELNDPQYALPTMVRKMVTAGWLGRKTGKGFYDYSKHV